MEVIGPCLTIRVRSDGEGVQRILPIWPIGFEAFGGEGRGVVLRGPLGVPTSDAVNSELLELNGDYVDVVPDETVVLPECAAYRMFLVEQALNIAK